MVAIGLDLQRAQSGFGLHQGANENAHAVWKGMEETLSVHRLRVPEKLRATSRSTSPVESTFDKVEVICRNVKRWRGGDQYLRWIASGFLWAESRWNRIHLRLV